MNKKIKTTSEEFIESLSTQELKKFNEGYKDLALSELILHGARRNFCSKTGKIAGISPNAVQAMRSGTKDDFSMQSFFKILNGLGCKKIMIELQDGQYVPLNISHSIKK